MEAITNSTLNISLIGGNLTLLPRAYPVTAPNYQPTVMTNRIETARILVYSVIIIIAFLGNGLLVMTMMFTKKMRTTTNYFLLNMAVGDLLVAIFCAPYQLASWKHPNIKTFDDRICKTMPFVQLSTVGISIFTMVAIAVSRYRAVMNPLRKHVSRRACIIIIMLIWLASMITASPTIFVYQVKIVENDNGTHHTVKRCDEFGWANPKTDAAAYTYALFGLEYAVPGLFLGFLYLRIFLNLWYHRFPGMQDMSKSSWQKFRKKHYRRKKTVVMLLTVFLTFMICNLPLHVLSFIYFVEGPNFTPPSFMAVITTCAEMLVYANSAMNPILYGFMHRKFSACAKGLLKWMFCGERRPNYETIPFQKKSKQQQTFNSGVTVTSQQSSTKGGEQRNSETKF